MKKILIVSLLIALLLLSGCNKQGTSLNFAVEMNDHAAAAYIAKYNGDFVKYGIKVSSFNQYATGMALSAALTRGDINVGYVCVVPAILAYARGVPIKIVTLTHKYGYELVTAKSINSVKELDGKLVACPGEGSSANLIMKITEEKFNVKFNILRTKPLMEISAMEKGSVKAAFIPEHYASILVSKGFKILLKSQDVVPDMPGSCIVVKDDLLNKEPEAIKNLIRLTKKETKFINENREDAAKIVAKYLNCSPDIIEYSMSNLKYTDKIEEERIQYLIDKLAELGYVRKFNAKDILWNGK
ncbi:MAG: ABC transporter substrate-binding protein [Caldisericaceae bacterium]|nr:ABC transporter substrate-binding protein [Caldisericaceae bacterium]